MSHSSVTRGSGLLESFLSRKRADTADALIPAALRAGSILDIGCGSFPYFLQRTTFAKKHGIDRLATPAQIAEMESKGIAIVSHDVQSQHRLPFADHSFDVVTMLAVFEHIDLAPLQALIAEIHRVLKPGGAYVLTTPPPWSETILDIMTALRLISAEEIDEHKDTYTPSRIRALLKEGGFAPENVTQGTFECGLNLWACARKAS